MSQMPRTLFVENLFVTWRNFESEMRSHGDMDVEMSRCEDVEFELLSQPCQINGFNVIYRHICFEAICVFLSQNLFVAIYAVLLRNLVYRNLILFMWRKI